MAHSRGFDLSHFTDEAQDRFGRQFASLARDASQLSNALARYGNGARHDVSHFAHDLADGAMQQGAVAARVLGKQAWKAGKPVGVFPEGGSGHGDKVGTFHARIFQTALDANAPVQPVALRYGRDGRQDPGVPFGRKESFFANFLRVLGNPPMDAEIHFLEPVVATPDARRRMAEQSRERIVAALGYGD